jgi:sterol desaturase/sphingolipid hydroxylase (fatty acid hydroxylase superfamily)
MASAVALPAAPAQSLGDEFKVRAHSSDSTEVCETPSTVIETPSVDSATESPDDGASEPKEHSALQVIHEKLPPQNIIARMYRKLWERFKGDKGKLMLFTIVVLVFSEWPLWLFTGLDVLKLKSLYKYRLHYDPEVAGHLGVRKYPPNDLIWKTAKVAEFNFLCAYVIPGSVLIKIASKLGIYVYDTDHKDITWGRILKETFTISVFSDIAFYWLHRFLHTPRFYKDWHKMHHEFRYSIAVAHHWMTYKEALLFALPQAVPPVILGALSRLAGGNQMHVLSMWSAFVFTQLSVIVGHAGWQIPGLPKWLPVLQPEYHDFHHVDYKKNFGAIYTLTDKVFGTYIKAIVDPTHR